MKIDKRNLKHWYYLLKSGVYLLLAAGLRPFLGARRPAVVVLYGHKLNGNLKAFADYWSQQNSPQQCYYMTMDPAYYRQLKAEHPAVPVLSLLRLSDVLRLGRSTAVITDHGLHTITILKKLSNIKFIDVWHGIPYKGFTPDDFAVQRGYDQVWVSSEYMKKVYMEQFGFEERRLKVTGYADADPLINRNYDPRAIKQRYGITSKRVILFAPTWKQDDRGRSIVPFGLDTEAFFSALDRAAADLGATLIFRAHLNSGDAIQTGNLSHTRFMSYAQYPVAQEFLAIADVLVSDWSSIVFNYLVLKRPTIFIDTPPPFKNGFTLDETYRFGPVVDSMDSLIQAISTYLGNEAQYRRDFKAKLKRADEAAYGNMADGRASERYTRNLQQLIKESRS